MNESDADDVIQESYERNSPSVDVDMAWEMLKTRMADEEHLEPSPDSRARTMPVSVGDNHKRSSAPKGLAPKRWSGLRIAVYASVAVVLVAALTVGGLEAVKHVGANQPIVVITDDTVGFSPGSTGQTTQTTATDTTTQGGYVNVLVMDPSDPSVLYAGTTGGLFKSTDGAGRWNRLPTIEGSVWQIHIDPTAPSTVYTLGEQPDGLLHRSEDGGANWRTLTDPGLSVWPPVMYLDPTSNPSAVCALGDSGGSSGMLRSTDRGETWTELSPEEAEQTWALRATPSTRAPDAFLASFTGFVTDADTGAVVSTSGAVQTGPDSVIVDPDHPSIFYVGTEEGVYKSVDGGKTWKKASAGLASSSVPTTEVTTPQSMTTSTKAATTTTEALVPMTAAEIAQRKTDAIAFADRFYGAWPDPDATFAELAGDAYFYDPSNGDFLIEGKQQVVGIHRGFFSYFPDIRPQRQGAFLSADGAAYPYATENLWPPWVPEPADHPPIGVLDLFRFRDGLAASYEIWMSAATFEMIQYGVFTPGKGGSEQLQEIADRYLAAWASGDKAQIAALYGKEAVFSDTMHGLQAQGPAAIAELGDKRFGSASKITLNLIDLYVQTNGPYAPTEQLPQQGGIVGVGIHYRCNLVVNGQSKTVESLTTFELGTRQGKSFAPDPNGLITREEMFYDPDSLLASGLVN